MDLRVSDDPSTDAARLERRTVARCSPPSRARRSRCSGGSTSPPMFAALARSTCRGSRSPCGRSTNGSRPTAIRPQCRPTRPAAVPRPADAGDERGPRAPPPARYGRRCPSGSTSSTSVSAMTATPHPGRPVPTVIDEHAARSRRRRVQWFERMTITPPVVNRPARGWCSRSGRQGPDGRRWCCAIRRCRSTRLRRTGTIVFVDPAAAADLPSPDHV